jgi:lipopolysaccharide/colanic/teichoic acid biosynthesis glycosyltransferase
MRRYRQGGVAGSGAPEGGRTGYGHSLPGRPESWPRRFERRSPTGVNQVSSSATAPEEALETYGIRRRGGTVPPPALPDLSVSSRESLAALDWNRLLDIAIAAVALVVLSPLIALVALAVTLDSRGPVFFRCNRVGRGGRPFTMFKFRKMRNGVSDGPPLTGVRDDRFTRIGGLLAKTKLDEIPQLWNVLGGAMSLVGPRPEDAAFVRLHPEQYAPILCVRPGITGLSQLAFANEAEILAVDDRLNDYVDRILPQKMRLDRLYVERRSLWMDLKILAWTLVTVGLRREAAVHRTTGRLTLRHRDPRVMPASVDSPALADSAPSPRS